jgi:hypothetical protein
MKTFRKYWYYYLLVLIIFLTIFIIGVKQMDKHWQKIHKAYPFVKREQALNDRVINLFTERGASYVLTKDSIKYSFRSSANYDYKNYYLTDFLQEGDSLVKRRNTDTLYIYRDNEKYYFIHGKDINQEK